MPCVLLDLEKELKCLHFPCFNDIGRRLGLTNNRVEFEGLTPLKRKPPITYNLQLVPPPMLFWIFQVVND